MVRCNRGRRDLSAHETEWETGEERQVKRDGEPRQVFTGLLILIFELLLWASSSKSF